MRKIVILILIISCSQDDEIQMGCMTGYNKSDQTRTIQLIRCCTREQFLAGSNTDLGGMDRVKYFGNLNWTPVDDCSKCN